MTSARTFGGSQNPVLYLVWFIYGYLLMSDPRFQAALDRHTLTAFLLAILCTVFIFTVGQRICPAWSPLWILRGVVYVSSRWFCVVSLALYEALVRRINLLRFLFGMKRTAARIW